MQPAASTAATNSVGEGMCTELNGVENGVAKKKKKKKKKKKAVEADEVPPSVDGTETKENGEENSG